MKKKNVIAFLMALTLGASLLGCGGSNTEATSTSNEGQQVEEKKELVFGTCAPTAQYVDFFVEELERMGYDVEVITFDDFVTPNQALVEGSVDVTYHQHRAYMEAFNAENNASLYMLEPQCDITPFSIYSDKYDSIEEFPEGAKIGIPRDSSNASRALLILQDVGLITLEGDLDLYTIADIGENPKNIEIMQLDMAAVAMTMQDVDAGVIYNQYWINAGRDTSEALYTEGDVAYTYATGATVLEENKDTQWAKDVITAMTSQNIRKDLEEVAASKGAKILFS